MQHSHKALGVFLWVAVLGGSAAQAEWVWVPSLPHWHSSQRVTRPAPAGLPLITVDFTNESSETVKLFANRRFVMEVPAGLACRFSTQPGAISLQAYKTSSQTWRSLEVRENRDFGWKLKADPSKSAAPGPKLAPRSEPESLPSVGDWQSVLPQANQPKAQGAAPFLLPSAPQSGWSREG